MYNNFKEKKKKEKEGIHLKNKKQNQKQGSLFVNSVSSVDGLTIRIRVLTFHIFFLYTRLISF